MDKQINITLKARYADKTTTLRAKGNAAGSHCYVSNRQLNAAWRKAGLMQGDYWVLPLAYAMQVADGWWLSVDEVSHV